ncbi:hypothetical protein RYX36_010518, partial [Vicia faba]
KFRDSFEKRREKNFTRGFDSTQETHKKVGETHHKIIEIIFNRNSLISMYSSLPLNALIRDRHRFFFITTTSLQYSIINLTISSSILASHHLLQKCWCIINITFNCKSFL